MSDNITTQQVEQFFRETHKQLREVTGAEYATITATTNGFTGELEWGTYTGKEGDSIHGRNLAEVIDKAAKAMNPELRAKTLREKAAAMMAEADKLTTVKEVVEAAALKELGESAMRVLNDQKA